MRISGGDQNRRPTSFGTVRINGDKCRGFSPEGFGTIPTVVFPKFSPVTDGGIFSGGRDIPENSQYQNAAPAEGFSSGSGVIIMRARAPENRM